MSPSEAGSLRVDWWPRERLDDLATYIGEHWKPGHILSRDRELLVWQHPAPLGRDDALSVLVASDADKPVGILGLIEFPYCEAGARGRGAWLTTWAAPRNPAYPYVGLRLLERALELDYDLLGTLSGNETTQRILRARGFDVLDQVGRWCRAPGAAQAGPEPARWTEAADAWEQAWRHEFAPRLAGGCRSAAYVERRYARHPRFDYEIRVALDRGRATGLLVYRVEHVSGSDEVVVRVLEFLAEPHAGHQLAAALTRATEEAGAMLADFYCTSDIFTGPLEAVGFVRQDPDDRVPSRFQPLDPRARPLTAAFRRRGNETPPLYVTRADCDQDRPS